MKKLPVVGATLFLLLTSCAGELQTPGEALRIFGDSLPQAHLGEPYEAQVRAVGGLRPFTYRLAEGALPPGLSLEAGVLSGTPTETGSYEFTVTVSDANLSRTFEEYSLSVVERPPPSLSLVAPETEIRTPVTVRLRVTNASQLRALVAVVSWDEQRFELVEDSLEASVAGAAIVRQGEPGRLHLEMAALGEPWNGELTLAHFTLAPVGTAVLRPGLAVLLFDDRGDSHFQASPGGPPGNEEDAPVEDEPAAGEEMVDGPAAGEEIEDDIEDEAEEGPE